MIAGVKDHRATTGASRALDLDRRMRWAQLWLLRLAQWILQTTGAWAPLDRAVQKALAPAIAKLAKLIFAIIVLKADARATRPRKQRRYGPPRKPSGSDHRVLFGARLRKLARARDLRARISALLALVRDAETHIARCAKRLMHGLTRGEDDVFRDAFETQALCFVAFPADAANTS